MSDVPEVVAALRDCPATRYPTLLRQAIDDPASTDVRSALAAAMRADGVDWGELVELQIAWHELPVHERDRRRSNLVRQAQVLRNYPRLHRAVGGDANTRGRLSMGRGLVEHATLDAALVLAHAAELYALAPLMSLELFPMDATQASALAKLVELKCLRQLRLASPATGDAGVTALATSPHLSQLQTLELYDAGIGDATLRQLASVATFTLRRLLIANARLSSVDPVAHGPRLASLSELALEGRSIDGCAVRTLARSPLRLELLSLVATAAGAALDDLASSPVVEGLRTLILTHAGAHPDAASHLIGVLERLEALHLDGCAVGDAAAAKLATGLRQLTLRNAGLTPAGAHTLAPRALARLDLGCNALGDAGVEALATSAFAATMTRLNLEHNGIGPAGAAALAGMTSLVVLNLAGNPLGDEGARRLAELPLSHLELLILPGCGIGPEGARRLLDAPALASARRIVMTREVGPQIQQELRLRRRDLDPLLASDAN